MKTILVASAVVVAMASPALANHCPNDLKIVDQAMSKMSGMNKMKMTELKTLRDQGDAFHKSGKHAESIKALHDAAKILGVAPYKPS